MRVTCNLLPDRIVSPPPWCPRPDGEGDDAAAAPTAPSREGPTGPAGQSCTRVGGPSAPHHPAAVFERQELFPPSALCGDLFSVFV